MTSTALGLVAAISSATTGGGFMKALHSDEDHLYCHS
ncbi:hypothetical protein PPTG_21430 [Phytophthora nicotianae INRA-310]|uniref:Uncharacterized protein n=1 Tax=Phytophthora nicotianae (strain INRA-310) TaxID=761204 RepID=W2R1H3_PHYN3|nr:hypothetical protein PPTG_21430 [Phytophthora nicotianae INRA-310]ETN19203.1 hypothetical protein PPTG_21430 [Phytophthora nicotianae INRA-310]